VNAARRGGGGSDLATQVLAATRALSAAVDRCRFPAPVAQVYNPLDYAWPLHEQYVRRWGATRRRVLLLGMNPGPWGMAQTGVPFGEVAAVRDILGLDAAVGRPAREHPKRPVQGLACARSEVSGRRLWGFFAAQCGGPDGFFADHFVLNYCPLVFMEESARNLTPDKLPAAAAAPLFAACDDWLRQVIALYGPRWVVGVGGFARRKLDLLLADQAAAPRRATLLHPSPASPAANRGWEAAALAQLRAQGVWD
jgi:single-strand selective monofunctional uracil DNA glycosylase